VTAHLNETAIHRLLDPGNHTGLSADIADEQAKVAHRIAEEIRAHLSADGSKTSLFS
jgi:hypothetical protein